MITSHNLLQGSQPWHAFRAEHFGASEASAMLGLSPYKTRTQLLNEKKTGLTADVDAFTQKIFDKGHAVESLARPIVEKMIGEELSPMTFSNGKLSASCDGINFDGNIAWENKQFNSAHYEQVKNGELPEIHWPQCQQVLYCTGAEKLFFTISDGTEERTDGVWVYPDAELQSKVIAGWDQFQSDLVTHEVAEAKQAPKAQAILALPALSIAIKGEVTLSNLPEFTKAATAFIANINTDLVTDEDFANAEANVTFCKEAEENIEATKKSAIAQTASIDELMRTLDFISAQLRDKRLDLSGKVKTEKENRKLQIIKVAQDDLAKHFMALSAEIKPINLNTTPADFAGAIKGKKTITGMQGAVNQVLADSKIILDATARDIRTKQAWLKENADGYQFLFADIQTVIYKPMDDMQVLVKSRIAEHKQKEVAIKEKAEAEARAKLEREAQAEADAKAKVEAEAKAQQAREISKEILANGAVVDASIPEGDGITNNVINEADFSKHVAGVDLAAGEDKTVVTNIGKRPTAEAIINLVATTYGVDQSTAQRWLTQSFAQAKAA